MGKFVITQNDLGYWINLKSTNGKIIATSGEVLNTIPTCKDSIESIVTNAPTAPIEDQTAVRVRELKCPKFEIYLDKKGEYRFRLKARNGEPILASEGYTKKSGCKNGIESVRQNVVKAQVIYPETTD